MDLDNMTDYIKTQAALCLISLTAHNIICNFQVIRLVIRVKFATLESHNRIAVQI